MPPRMQRGFRRSDNLHLQQPATCDQEREDRDGDVRDRRVNLPSWTTRCARSFAASSPSSAFALMRSMIPNPSRRAASSTSESRLPILAARTLTWRIRPSSIAKVVFTRAISPYYHLAGEALYVAAAVLVHFDQRPDHVPIFSNGDEESLAGELE